MTAFGAFLSTATGVSNQRDLVFDASRGLLYITTADGDVERYDVSAKMLLAPLDVGVSLNGADISTDGTTLYVTEGIRSVSQGFVRKVNLNDGNVTNIPYDLAFGEGGAWDIAIGPSGRALVTTIYEGSGWTPMRELELADDSFEIFTATPGSAFNTVMGSASIHRSADRGLFLITEPNISSGPLFTHDTVSNTFPGQANSNQFLDGVSAVNRDGSLLAVRLWVGMVDMLYSVAITKPNFDAVENIGIAAHGVAFDPIRDLIYVTDAAADELVAIDTHTYQELYRVKAGADLSTSSFAFNEALVIDSKGEHAFVSTASGVRVLQLPENGSSADDLFSGSGETDFYFGLGGSDDISGNADDDALDGGDGADRISGGTGNDQIRGGNGDDVLVGGAGNDQVDGGSGFDTAVYGGAYKQHLVIGTPATSGNIAGPEGSDGLSAIEKLQFLDGSLNFHALASIWRVDRLYEATLERHGDPLGLNFWAVQLDNGTALSAVAAGFTASAEFQSTYGSLNDADFVNQLYLNVLDRPADPDGLAGWVNFLNGGGTHGEVVVGFSESQEFIDSRASQIAAGRWDIDETAGSVARLYWGTLDRAPDVAGLTNWVNFLKNGTFTLQQAAGGFTGSVEFQTVYGALSNSDFVNQLYLNVLERPADPGGLANWTGFLSAGWTRGQVALGFTESTEFQINMIGQIDNGIAAVDAFYVP